MDRSTAKALRIKLEKVFADADMDGMTVEIGNATYNSHEVTFKVQIRDAGAASPTERDLVMYAKHYDLDTDRVYKQGGRAFTLVGYKHRARKNPWIVRDLNTEGEYVIPTDTAKRWFGKEVA